VTERSDRITEAIDAYLASRFKGEAPAFDGLTPDERQEVEEFIELLKRTEELDPRLSEPSLESLLADTEFAGALAEQRSHHGRGGHDDSNLLSQLDDAIRNSGVVLASEPVLSSAEGWRFCTLRSNGHRVGVVVLTELHAYDELNAESALSIAGERLGAAPDLAAVLVVVADSELTAVGIDQQDVVSCIDAPSGLPESPSVRRRALPLDQAIHAIFDEIAPVFTDMEDVITSRNVVSETTEIIRANVRRAVDRITSQGRNARIRAKQSVWTAFGDREAIAIEGIVSEAQHRTMELDELRERISDNSEAA
jgi:hypothetical protein